MIPAEVNSGDLASVEAVGSGAVQAGEDVTRTGR